MENTYIIISLFNLFIFQYRYSWYLVSKLWLTLLGAWQKDS